MSRQAARPAPAPGAPSADDAAEAARAFCYAFLSHAFGYPGAAWLRRLRDGLDDLTTAVRVLGLESSAAGLTEALAEAEGHLPRLAGLHNALFATGLAAPAAETAYELDKAARRAAELADIQGFYGAFGMRLAAPIEPDGVVTELEFLGILVQKRLYARRAGHTEGERICTAAYEAFLADHLGRWYGQFLERLGQATDEPYYLELGRLMAAFLDRECQALDARPSPLCAYAKETVESTTWPCPTGCGASA
ncbi:MAG: molecular chaperone [Kiloniellales bacterium]